MKPDKETEELKVDEPMTRRTYTPEFKAQLVLALLKEEQPLSQLAATHGIHPNQLTRWREEVLAGLPGLFTQQAARQLAEAQLAHAAQLEQLYAQIGRLTTELTWLKKKLPG
jgi:transposase